MDETARAPSRLKGRDFVLDVAERPAAPTFLLLSLQHLFAMFGATVLVPVRTGLDASVAGDIEGAFAAAGHIIVSNARNFRMDPLVPLLIPEVNADHLSLLPEQRAAKGWSGAIVTNPNCSTIVLALALAPLQQFGLRSVVVSTMQAVSGAGYPGVPSLDILGNVVPFIGGEEEKMESETLKILGTNGGRSPYQAVVSAHTNRVAVLNGTSRNSLTSRIVSGSPRSASSTERR